MKQKEEWLVKGVFTPSQAKEVVTELFTAKIKMHSNASFKLLIKSGKESVEERSRVKELQASLVRLLQLINEHPNEYIKLDGVLKMEFIDKVDKD
ncbi:MAG: hypothetical protein U0U66_10135 [Cytophagaceae bacterium]